MRVERYRHFHYIVPVFRNSFVSYLVFRSRNISPRITHSIQLRSARLESDMTNVYVPESIPIDSQPGNSQRYTDYAFEPTQLSQPIFSQTQNTQGISSQVEPRRKYCKPITVPGRRQGPCSSLQIPVIQSSSCLGPNHRCSSVVALSCSQAMTWFWRKSASRISTAA